MVIAKNYNSLMSGDLSIEHFRIIAEQIPFSRLFLSSQKKIIAGTKNLAATFLDDNTPHFTYKQIIYNTYGCVYGVYILVYMFYSI